MCVCVCVYVSTCVCVCVCVYTGGANRWGELGHGDRTKRPVPRLVKALKGAGLAAGGAGGASVYAVCMGFSHAGKNSENTLY